VGLGKGRTHVTSGEGNNDVTLDDGEITRAELEEMTMGNMRRWNG
jgi:hypothetical protein